MIFCISLMYSYSALIAQSLTVYHVTDRVRQEYREEYRQNILFRS